MPVRSSRSSLVNLSFAVCVVAACLGWASVCNAETASAPTLSPNPRDVFVSQTDVYCRCGPGETYYRTDPLRHSQQLTVYAETSDGWLGIRPPARSFDWIQSSVVTLDPGGETGRVTEDRSVAWIGTSLGRAKRFRWQVQLAENESVTIIGRSMRDGPDGPQEWFKIVPPSGEFRWVHRDDVVGSSEELLKAADANSQPSLNDVQVVASDANLENAMGEDPNLGRSILQSSHTEAAAAHEPAVAPAGSGAGAERTGRPARLVDRPKHQQTYQASLGSPRVGTSDQAAPSTQEPSEEGWIASTIRKLSGGKANRPGANDAPVDSDATSFETTRIDGPSMTTSPPLTASDLTVVERRAGERRAGGPMVPLTAASSVAADATPTPGGISTKQSPSVRTPSPTPIELADAASKVAAMDAVAARQWLSELMIDRGPSEMAEILARHAQTKSVTDAGASWSAINEQARRYAEMARRRDGGSTSAWSEAPAAPSVGLARTESTWTETSPIANPASGPRVNPPVIAWGTPTAQPASPTFPADTFARTEAPSGNEASDARSRVVATSWQDPEGRELASMTGQLVELYSARPGSPPFALVDSTGTTLCYVSPIPGINLGRHVNSRVQLDGSIGYLAGISTPLLRANQAVRR